MEEGKLSSPTDAKESEIQLLSRLLGEQSELLHSLEDSLGFVTSPEPREATVNAPIQESLHISVLNERLRTNNNHIKYIRRSLVV